MKLKVLTKISLLLFGIGVILFGVGISIYAITGYSVCVDNLLVDKKYTCKENISTIMLQDSSTDVVIEPYSGDSVKFSYNESYNTKYQISEESGKLIIEKEDSREWFDKISWSSEEEKATIAIQVPRNYSGKIKLTTYDCSIDASNLCLEEFYILSTTTSINIENISSATMLCNTNNADISIKNTNIGNYTNVMSLSGDVVISEFAGNNLNISSNNGDILMTEVSLKDTVKIKSSNGDFDFHSLNIGNKIQIEAFNGSVSGSIVGSANDFSIIEKVVNGNSNLPYSDIDGDKLLDITTSNGDIEIAFDGN